MKKASYEATCAPLHPLQTPAVTKNASWVGAKSVGDGEKSAIAAAIRGKRPASDADGGAFFAA
ncbi:hypothetical protein [Lysobacter panacisoli]|uniref:hypothetical protein n=1 Tax=Lysobacter panacisoli TaxID=1255263 RepID=UPI00131C5B22|nr:hypothetical protein [Lysobacter panacisoli]